MSVENDPGFWKWVAGGLVSLFGGGWGFLKWHHAQMEKKADKEATEKETANCLRHIEELYKNAESDRRLTRDLHDKAMEGIRSGQDRIIELLSRR